MQDATVSDLILTRLTPLLPTEKDGYFMGFLLSSIPCTNNCFRKNRLATEGIFYSQRACHHPRQCFQSGCELTEMTEFSPGDRGVSFAEKWNWVGKGCKNQQAVPHWVNKIS